MSKAPEPEDFFDLVPKISSALLVRHLTAYSLSKPTSPSSPPHTPPSGSRSICTSPLQVAVTDDPEMILTQDVVSLFKDSLNRFLYSLKAMNVESSNDHIGKDIIQNATPISSIIKNVPLNIAVYIKVAKYIKDSYNQHPTDTDSEIVLNPQEILVFAAMGTDTTNIANLKSLLHPLSNDHSRSPYSKQSFPITDRLRSELEHEEMDPETFATLQDAIEFLEISIQNSIELNSPVPLFKRIWLVDYNMHTLLNSRNFFALRILFVFSSLCIITRLQFMNEINVWVDYIESFKNYSLSISSKSELDAELYDLVILNKYRIEPTNLKSLSSFDPSSLLKNSMLRSND